MACSVPTFGSHEWTTFQNLSTLLGIWSTYYDFMLTAKNTDAKRRVKKNIIVRKVLAKTYLYRRSSNIFQCTETLGLLLVYLRFSEFYFQTLLRLFEESCYEHWQSILYDEIQFCFQNFVNNTHFLPGLVNSKNSHRVRTDYWDIDENVAIKPA